MPPPSPTSQPDQGLTAILLSDESAPRSAELAALRHALIRALHALRVPMIPTAELHLSHHLEHLPESSRLLLVADTRAALTAAREMTASRRGTLHCLLVAPTSFPGAGGHTPPWAVGLESSAGESVVYLTDSALSRAIVERQVSTVRADVRVLTPAERAMDEPATGIAAMKTWRPGERQPEYGRTCWDFRDRTSGGALDRLRGLLPRRRRHSEPEATNAEVLRELLTGRTLDGAPLHIGVLGHKLTFIDELTRDLGHASGSTIELDEWKNLGAPSDVAHARGVLSRADVIIGEWGRPNNVWIQKHAAPHKRLIVRVHRYEVTTDFPHAIDMDRFDAGVVIVPWVGRALVQKYSWPAEKIVYIPNYVNTRYFRRHKLPGAEHTLGIVGITPDLKRLDLALDLLARLRAEDLRYSLRVRGQLPPEHLHWTTNPRIAAQWESILFRLRTDPLLRSAVHFDPPGRDMAAWLEQIGIILSTSDLEGSHVALAEGMASGALPIVRPWPGVRTLWPEECIVDSLENAAQRVLRSRDAAWREDALHRVAAHPALDQDRVLRAWWDLLNGRRERAQEAYGPIDWHTEWYEPVPQN